MIVSILRKLINGTIKNIYLSKISQQKIAIQYCHYGLPCIVTQLNRIITYLMFQHTFSLKLHDFSHQFINIQMTNMKISEIINLILERMRSGTCTGTGRGIRGNHRNFLCITSSFSAITSFLHVLRTCGAVSTR